jgi:hypothetical protein
MLCGLLALVGHGFKIVSLSRYSDPTRPVEVVFFASSLSIFLGPVVWTFLFSFATPIVVGLPNYAQLKVTMTRAFVGGGGICAAVMFLVVLAQLLDVEGESRVAVSTSFFVCLSSVAVLLVSILTAGGYKVITLRVVVLAPSWPA